MRNLLVICLMLVSFSAIASTDKYGRHCPYQICEL